MATFSEGSLQAQALRGEIDRDDRGNVGNGEPAPGDKAARSETLFQITKKVLNSQPPSLDERGNLVVGVRSGDCAFA